jgi:hypothetical protein
MNTKIQTAEADAAYQAGRWARAAALYREVMDTMPQATRTDRQEWHRIARLQQSADESASFVRCVNRTVSEEGPTPGLVAFISAHYVEFFIDGNAVVILGHLRARDGSYTTELFRVTDLAGARIALGY